MKRVIVDYSKLTNEILNLLVERFPDGYDDSNIIRFKNHKDETIEAVEVRTEDTIYLVKISTKLSERMVNFEDDDDIVVPLEAIKGIEMEDEDAPTDEDEEDEDLDKPEFDDDDDDDFEKDDKDYSDEDEDEDED
jgi:DNA-directed RNA polymerase subunit delta